MTLLRSGDQGRGPGDVLGFEGAYTRPLEQRRAKVWTSEQLLGDGGGGVPEITDAFCRMRPLRAVSVRATLAEAME